jgi:hypothetical protein
MSCRSRSDNSLCQLPRHHHQQVINYWSMMWHALGVKTVNTPTNLFSLIKSTNFLNSYLILKNLDDLIKLHMWTKGRHDACMYLAVRSAAGGLFGWQVGKPLLRVRGRSSSLLLSSLRRRELSCAIGGRLCPSSSVPCSATGHGASGVECKFASATPVSCDRPADTYCPSTTHHIIYIISNYMEMIY